MAEKLIRATVKVVAAYVNANSVHPDDVRQLIWEVHAKLVAVEAPLIEEPPRSLPSPAQIRNSIKPDYLISFENGRHYRMLQRHLTNLGLTPNQYRIKWGLPSSYPMICFSCSALRSDLAKEIGLRMQEKRKARSQPLAAKKLRTRTLGTKTRLKGA